MLYADEDTPRELDHDPSVELDQNRRCWRHIAGNILVGIGGFISIPSVVILARQLWNLVTLEESLPVSETRCLLTLAITGLAWIVAGVFFRRGRLWIAISTFAIGYVLLALGLPDR